MKQNEGRNGFYYGICDTLLQRQPICTTDDDDSTRNDVTPRPPRHNHMSIRQTADSLSGYMAHKGHPDSDSVDEDGAASYIPPQLPEHLSSSVIKARRALEVAMARGGEGSVAVAGAVKNASMKMKKEIQNRKEEGSDILEFPLQFNLPFQWPPNKGLYYYGIEGDMFQKEKQSQRPLSPQSPPSPGALSPEMEEAPVENPEELIEEMTKSLSEFRSMTEELRRSLSAMEKQMSILSQSIHLQKTLAGLADEDGELSSGDLGTALNIDAKKRRRALQFDSMADEVERWAMDLFEETTADGWDEVKCSKLLRNRFTNHEKVKCFLKWLPDTRDGVENGTLYPCIKVHATINAPVEKVHAYLSNPKSIPEYNDLVVEHADVETVSSRSKITWAKCPQILFIKPRDFVTFCHLRWKRDGTQVVLNQAVDHENRPPEMEAEEPDEKGDVKACRAYALRGANFIGKGEGEGTTTFSLLAHADPGGDLPQWAMKTAINTLVPIEPFKLFHRIEKGANKVDLDAMNSSGVDATFVSNGGGGIQQRLTGGLSQLGYACFWPGEGEHVNENLRPPVESGVANE